MKRRLFAPAVALMDRLTYPRKFLLISVLFGIPLALATYFLFGEINDSLEIARPVPASLVTGLKPAS